MCSATSGAWGARAARDGAAEVLCVDSSAAALELAAKNAERNCARSSPRARAMPSRCSRPWRKEGARFDIVIVDPPAFAKRKKDLPKALAAYKRLNQLAMQLLDADGILVSCSCSYHVSAEELQEAIAKAARGADKHLQLLEMGGQAPDHPGASGDSGNALSQSLFLSRERQFKVARMLTYPHINPIAISIGPLFGIGPLRVHWYGIMYLIGFVAAWWLARYRARRPGSTWTRARHR